MQGRALVAAMKAHSAVDRQQAAAILFGERPAAMLK